MADENDDVLDTLEERLENIQRRAENFRELLRDGDEVTVALQDGELHVAESYRSKFERMHPKLFGRLLGIEEQMKTGAFPYFVGLVGVVGFVIGLQLQWWEGTLGEAMCSLFNGWWFYILAPLATLYLVHVLGGRWGVYVYRRHRRELLQLIAAEKLDRDVLLVMLRGDELLDIVVYHLKLDTGPFVQP